MGRRRSSGAAGSSSASAGADPGVAARTGGPGRPVDMTYYRRALF
jgi:hypothetical protein